MPKRGCFKLFSVPASHTSGRVILPHSGKSKKKREGRVTLEIFLLRKAVAKASVQLDKEYLSLVESFPVGLLLSPLLLQWFLGFWLNCFFSGE